jgi:hypothetical protein
LGLAWAWSERQEKAKMAAAARRFTGLPPEEGWNDEV